MREILFRGKRKDNGEWETGFLVIVRGGCSDEKIYIADKMTGYHTPIIPETVGQYTGLKDENGTKIFEGDVVEFESHGYIPNIERGVVIFKNGYFGIEYISDVARKYNWGGTVHQIGTTTEWKDMGAGGVITYTYEKIGNIHDNPELLKGGVE